MPNSEQKAPGTPHVCMVTTVHTPFDTRIFHKECQTLVRAGYRVSLVAAHTRRETIQAVDVVPIPRYRRRAARMLAGAWAAFATARRLRADVYHVHDPELLPVSVLLKWTTRARVVYDAHENYGRQLGSRAWMPRPLRGILPRLVGGLERGLVRALDAVVCATEHIAANLSHRRALVVKNYPLVERTAAPPNEEAYSPHNQRIIYTGGWSPDRGVYQIVQALEHVRTPGCRLILLGQAVSATLQQEAARLPGYSMVDYLGRVPYDEMYRHLSSAAVGMVCNQPIHDFDKAQPNKLFEYMSAAIPVIASDFYLWQEIVAGNGCGINVDPTRPEAIAQAIDRLLADPELRRQMGQRGRSAVLTTYNWDAEGQKLVNLYKELLS